MKKHLVLVVALTVSIGAIAIMAGSASANYWRHCGDSIISHELGCGNARSVGRGYLRGLSHFNSSPSPMGFSCQSRKVSPRPVFHVTCRREKRNLVQQVRFFYEWGSTAPGR